MSPSKEEEREQESETNAGTSFTAVIKEKWPPPAAAEEAQAQAAKKGCSDPGNVEPWTLCLGGQILLHCTAQSVYRWNRSWPRWKCGKCEAKRVARNQAEAPTAVMPTAGRFSFIKRFIWMFMQTTQAYQKFGPLMSVGI